MSRRKRKRKEKRRTRPGSPRTNRSNQKLGATRPPEKGRTVVATMTGEFYQPVRAHYSVFNFQQVLEIFNKLRCMDIDPTQDRWAWLYMAEARILELKKKIRSIKPVVLGSFLKTGPNEMALDLRSFERATQGIVFFDTQIPRSAAEVTDVSVVNRLFDCRENISSTFDRFFDNKAVVRKDPEKWVQEMKSLVSEVQDENEGRSLAFDYVERSAREPLLEIERFPTHFYEDGIVSLRSALRVRRMVALQHWLGNTSCTCADCIQEMR